MDEHIFPVPDCPDQSELVRKAKAQTESQRLFKWEHHHAILFGKECCGTHTGSYCFHHAHLSCNLTTCSCPCHSNPWRDALKGGEDGPTEDEVSSSSP